MRPLARLGVAGVALCTSLGMLSGCTSDRTDSTTTAPPGAYQLVAFDSCDDALSGLRAAGRAAVGPYGFDGGIMTRAGGAAEDMARVPQANAGAPAAAGSGDPQFSGTNTHEAGVDEPDLVKTDGRRIVTVSGSTLTVLDAASRTVTGTLNLSDTASYAYQATELLLSGDQALVLTKAPYGRMMIANDVAQPARPSDLSGPRLQLISLAGAPRLLSTVTADGSLLDARQVGATVRVVLQSAPRIVFPYEQKATDVQRTAANQAIIDKAPLADWLPRIETTTGGATSRATIDCGEISRPDSYSGTNLITVLSFTLGGATLGDGLPTSLVADGNTVYSNGPSLYVASDRRFVARPMVAGAAATPVPATTQLYKFDISAARPTFAAGGSVPGYLINQYAMSEWNGNLRVATTTPAAGPGTNERSTSASGVYVLSPHGRQLTIAGQVEGLGKGEQIRAVRFLGPTGYVVTFKQTDPLYTVDLRDPARPVVRGELKIPGYSAYLHPVSDTTVLGIGQDATTQGRATGTQVSLFDVADLSAPKRIAQYSLSGAYSEAEFDPHAFLFWPASGLLVVPLQVVNRPGSDATARVAPTTGALMLRITGQSIQQVGFVQHPASARTPGYAAQIRRSLVIDKTLWTVSDAGLMASTLDGGNQLAWVPLVP